MIRTVPTPGSSCHAGGNCCDSCRGTSHTVTSMRNAALKSRLGEVTCDSAGNCYDVTYSIQYEGAPDGGSAAGSSADGSAMALPPLGPGFNPAQAPSFTLPAAGISKTALYIGGAILLVLLLEGGSRSGRGRK
jgi:hypothetical protein